MTVILGALADLGPTDRASSVTDTDTALGRQLTSWGNPPAQDPLDPGVLLLGPTAWTRLHGIISLEIEGVFTQMGIDPTRLYNTEIDHLIAQRTGVANPA